MRIASASLLLLVWAASAGGWADADGRQLYETYCAQCHGVQANGNGINAPHMSVQPRDHTDPSEMGTRTDEELFKVIKHGGISINKSVLMPPWEGNLSDGQIQQLVTHLRALCCIRE